MRTRQARLKMTFIGAVVFPLLAAAFEQKDVPWSLEWLARDARETVANPPFGVSWSKDGSALYFSLYDPAAKVPVWRAVDPSRVGILGGSYGGFYTLMALFPRPGVFAAGVDLYPCPDWFQYTRRFVNRFLGLPAGNEELYRKCSPLYQAEGLAAPLLLFHGLEDGNVFAQDTIRLVQRLIELGKTGWDCHLYPVEGHGWRREETKLDSYRRLTAFFQKHLLGPRSWVCRRD